MASQEDALAAAAEELAVQTCFTSLPLALLLVIFALLPVDARLRCREVCRSWRAVLRERSLWLRLDLSTTAGLARPATDALLRAAAAPAGGQLQFVHVSDCHEGRMPCLLAVVTANAGALRELRAWAGDPDEEDLLGFLHVAALLRAAPQLRVFDADVNCHDAADAQRLLRNEGAFAPLQLRKLEVFSPTEAAVLSLAADVAAHASLTSLWVSGAPLNTPAALDAIAAVALANRLSAMMLFECRLCPASAPALARLLGGGALRSLDIVNGVAPPLLHAAAAEVLRDALRANSTLDTLALESTDLWHDPAAAVTLLGAMTAHRSLREVSLFYNPIGDAQGAAGAALGALVAADAPALLKLDLRVCGWQEAALGPLVDALPANTHLCTLWLGTVTASAAFLRERLLHAVRANTTLMSLDITVTGDGESVAREAQEIVNSRRLR